MLQRTLTHELFQAILERIETGEMLAIILREDGMPSRTRFYAFMDAEPSRRDAYTRARLSWCDYWAEKVMMISLDRSGDIMVEDGKAVADHARIQLGKWGRRTYGDRVEAEAASLEGPITFSWIKSDPVVVEPAPEPPRQLTFQPPKLPGDLSTEDWSLMGEVLSLIRATIPTNADLPPAQVFAVLKAALLEHFRDDPPAKPVVLKPRGKSKL